MDTFDVLHIFNATEPRIVNDLTNHELTNEDVQLLQFIGGIDTSVRIAGLHRQLSLTLVFPYEQVSEEIVMKACKHFDYMDYQTGLAKKSDGYHFYLGWAI